MSLGKSVFKRTLEINPIQNPLTESSAVFFFGPRQTGKTTFLKQQYPRSFYLDLLDTDRSAELSVRPALLREQVLAERPLTVIIDEIQKVPALLEEVHWMLVNTDTQFILCGSSARKLKRNARNLLGGRAVEVQLFPLTSAEIPNLDLDKYLNHGGLPVHYLKKDPAALLRSYVNAYIKEEIIDESLTRNIPSFSRFLQIVGLTAGRQLNFANVARESGVSANTARNYYEILKDTLLGFELRPWRKRSKRRLTETSKFFVFDVGVSNALNPEGSRVTEGSDVYGRAFEHFLINEIRAYLGYRQKDLPLAYWRTSSGLEVDLIVGDLELALEFKSAREIRNADFRGIRALQDEHRIKRPIIVSRDERKRKTEDGIELMHWSRFLDLLWRDQLI